jgi:hypothetical protein
MKVKIFLIGLIGLLVLLSCKKEPPTLPDETQEGLGTFGCLINGELVIAKRSLRSGVWVQNVSARYYSATDELIIKGVTEENEYDFQISVTNPKVGQTEAVFTLEAGNVYYKTGVSYINLTKFDRTRNIASGTFEFDADCYDFWDDSLVVSQKKIEVRKGRFNLKF